MRCKNCGFENEPERYICQNCGSPLYDDGEEIADDMGIDPDDEEGDIDSKTDKRKTRTSIIVIVILSVLLIAMITGIITLASIGGKPKEQESSSITTTEDDATSTSSTTQESSTATTTEPTTEEPTSETTTVTTTAPTTVPTTAPTTEATQPTVAEYAISVDIDGNGSVSGDGTYKAGEKANLIATADSGSQFIGWYDNATGKQVASGANYTVTVQKALSLTARFEPISTESEAPDVTPGDEGEGNEGSGENELTPD